MKVLGLFLLVSSVAAFAGDKTPVKIVQRQTNENAYTYVTAGFSSLNTTASATGYGSSYSGNAHTTGISIPGTSGTYTVRGATYSLLLPDGRMAVVNCEGKGRGRNRRDCRMPLVNDIQVEFSGDKAKLFWVVSIDGKKSASETYKILGILEAQR